MKNTCTQRSRFIATSVLIVGATFTLVLAGCSSSSEGSATDASGASESSSTESAPGVEATSLVLKESDFPTGGTYKVLDRAAIAADKGSSSPTITPEACAKLGDDSEDGDYDKAKAAWESDALQIDATVKMGVDESFDTVREQVTKCPSMSLTSTLDQGGTVTATLNNTITDVTGANKPALAVVSEGTAKVGDQELPMQLTSIGSYVDGATISISVTKIGGQMTDEEGALAVGLLNKQIAAVVNAA